MELLFIIFWGFIAFVVLLEIVSISSWCDDRIFRADVREWCVWKVKEDEVALTDDGIEAMTDYICKKMEGRSDKREVEFYIPPSVYKRIANEYRPKEW